MFRLVLEFLLIYFIVHTLWRMLAGTRRGRRREKRGEGRQAVKPRFDTSDRDVADAEYEEIRE